jgi:ABC-type antimicrobial peptide transport system permease subunit
MQDSWYPVDTVTYELRVVGASAGILREVQRIVAEEDPRVPIAAVKTQSKLIEGTIEEQVTFARLCTIFAVLALTIACVGLYGTTWYAVARRTNEIGIRMALGAQRARVVRMILSEVFILVAIGVAVSIPFARGTSRLVASFLYGVKPGDPLAITTAVGALAIAALVAGYVPARRASRIDPMVALRHE